MLISECWKHSLIFKINQSLKLSKSKDVESSIIQKVEILCALQKLGEQLNEEEKVFLESNLSSNMKQFELATDSKIGKF